MSRMRIAAATLAVAIAWSPIHAAVIDFNNLASSSGTFSTTSEYGYNLSYVSGDLRGVSGQSYASNSLQTQSSGTFSIVKADGGLFGIGDFNGFTTQGSTPTTLTYTLAGYLNGVNTYNQTLSQSGFLNGSTGTFSPTPGTNAFDTLRITLATSTSTAYIDNITVNAAAVPEPSSWAMMVGGFGLLGAALRRRRVSVRFA